MASLKCKSSIIWKLDGKRLIKKVASSFKLLIINKLVINSTRVICDAWLLGRDIMLYISGFVEYTKYSQLECSEFSHLLLSLLEIGIAN